MDIAALSVVMKQAQVKQQASLEVVKKAMNTAETNGNYLIEMLEQSTPPSAPHPHLGTKIDLRA